MKRGPKSLKIGGGLCCCAFSVTWDLMRIKAAPFSCKKGAKSRRVGLGLGISGGGVASSCLELVAKGGTSRVPGSGEG